METPQLTRVMRLDSIPLADTFFTDEGYLRDEPIVTSCGIFEYSNADGTIRRELRLPDEVFNKDSLKSYVGKPIIITHNAGSIDKENVSDEIVGTILSEGYRDGNYVRCKIVIHDIDHVKKLPYRELSLGYNLDLVEKPGEWNGMKYDAVQTNIRINHLAIVGNARAGEQARLNLDGQSKDLEYTEKGGNAMANKKSGLTPEELEEAVKAYREQFEGNTDADDVPETEEAEAEQEKPIEATDEDDVKVGKGKEPQDIIEEIREQRDSRKDEDLENPEDMKKIINRQDADIDKLIACLEKTLADLQAENTDADDTEEEEEEMPEEENTDGKDSEAKAKAGEENDSEDEEIPEEEEPKEEPKEEEEPTEEEEPDKTDSCKKKNADSVDQIIKSKLAICRAGDRLNMDGLEDMSIADGKKAIIARMNPSIRLDGRSDAYIDAMYDLTVADVYRNDSKTVDDQRKQASAKTGMRTDHADRNMTAAQRARQRMIEGGI